MADRTLEDIEEALEDLNDQWDSAERGDIDISNAQGVLTLQLGEVGTWVLNKQTPNKQIWWSSPLSGPMRFNYVNGEWVGTRSQGSLLDLLEAEVQEQTGLELEIQRE